MKQPFLLNNLAKFDSYLPKQNKIQTNCEISNEQISNMSSIGVNYFDVMCSEMTQKISSSISEKIISDLDETKKILCILSKEDKYNLNYEVLEEAIEKSEYQNILVGKKMYSHLLAIKNKKLPKPGKNVFDSELNVEFANNLINFRFILFGKKVFLIEELNAVEKFSSQNLYLVNDFSIGMNYEISESSSMNGAKISANFGCSVSDCQKILFFEVESEYKAWNRKIKLEKLLS